MLSGTVDFLVACVKTTVEDVLLQRVVEEQWLLLDEAKPLAKRIHVQSLDINAVYKNLAELRIVETHD